MAVLKGDDIHGALDSGKDGVPLAFMAFERHDVLLRSRSIVLADVLASVDIRGNHGRQTAGNLLAIASQTRIQIDDLAGIAAALLRNIPSRKGFAMPVTAPRLVDHTLVQRHFLFVFAAVPVLARIVESEPEVHPPLVAQAQEHIDQIDGRFVTPLLGREHPRGKSLPAAVAAADQDHGVDAGFAHVAEVAVPFGFAPVLMGNIMTDFVEKSSFYSHNSFI